jgi:hypothetical protein
MNNLPKVIATSVIRSSHQGESHGGAYIVDLNSDSVIQVLDWNTVNINWEGRGFDRGLRGIAFYKGCVYLAASDEIFVYDQNFIQQTSYKNQYLKHCHEIFICGEKLYLTSTQYDSILEFDLEEEQFTTGYLLRYGKMEGYLNKIQTWFLPRLTVFDPHKPGGPVAEDSLHINNVTVKGQSIYVSGRKLGNLLEIQDQLVKSFSAIPIGTHNAQPFGEGIIFNSTNSDCVTYQDLDGSVKENWEIVRYPENDLRMAHLPQDHARQAFGRGLCFFDDLVIVGSSPATVSVYKSGQKTPVKTINLSMDVRNAIHGLEIWPY